MSQTGNTRGYSLPAVKVPRYIAGPFAQDICRLTGLSLDPAGKFLDVGRMSWVDRLRVAFAIVGGHYYCDVQEGITRPLRLKQQNQCMGCQASWPFGTTLHGFTIHQVVGGYPGEIVGCSREDYAQ